MKSGMFLFIPFLATMANFLFVVVVVTQLHPAASAAVREASFQESTALDLHFKKHCSKETMKNKVSSLSIESKIARL
jgi:hypothetical protein